MSSIIQGLLLREYRQPIHLDSPFIPSFPGSLTDVQYTKNVDLVVKELLEEIPAKERPGLPKDTEQKRAMIKALLTIRSPEPWNHRLLDRIGTILQYEKDRRGMIHTTDLPRIQAQYRNPSVPPELVLWRGDITRLDADAIVNAANNQMLGCFQPFHACIDNAIHSAAGPMLREDCDHIMNLQGYPEPTGTAKITRGYHLPAKFVLHTVGPIIPHGTDVTEEQRTLLASCYTSCLTLAAEMDAVRSIAFCGISTGVFGYPKMAAAAVAVDAVCSWLRDYPGRMDRIIFNVYGEEDLKAYERIFTER